MQFEEYIEKSLRTESVVERVEANKTELNYVLGAFVVVSEMLDCLKKKIYYNKSTKYDEQFHDLAERLHFLTTCSDRHHDIPENEVLDIDPRVFHGIIGVATESGELVSALQKAINGHNIDAVNVMEEMGDAFWYIAILHDTLKLNPSRTMITNVLKLAERFKDKYSDIEAEIRDLKSERDILEQGFSEALDAKADRESLERDV